MGGKPKMSDYRPSDIELAQRNVANEDMRYFQRTYDPLLLEMRDKAMTEDTGSVLRGRAQADAMSAMTDPELMRQMGGTGAPDIFQAGDIASGAVSQMLSANAADLDVKNKMKTNVLGIARKQAADAGDALAQASRLSTSEGLAKAHAKMTIRLARRQMAFDIAEGAGKKMLKNLGDTGTLFQAYGGLAGESDTGKILEERIGAFGKSQLVPYGHRGRYKGPKLISTGG